MSEVEVRKNAVYIAKSFKIIITCIKVIANFIRAKQNAQIIGIISVAFYILPPAISPGTH